MKREALFKRGLRFLGGTAGAMGLLFFCLAVPANATSTWVALSLPFGYYVSTSGTTYATLASYGLPATAWGTADATNGTLKAFAQTTTQFYGYASDEANLGFHDTFTLHGPAPGTNVPLMASLTLDGTLSGDMNLPYYAASNADVQTEFQVLYGIQDSQYDFFSASGRTVNEYNDCFFTGCSGFLTPVHWVDTLLLTAVSAEKPFDIIDTLRVRGGWGAGGTSDFSHTAAISFNLPPGTWITSDGGYTQGGQAPVPEPSTLLLLGSGIMGFAAMRIRKFRKKG